METFIESLDEKLISKFSYDEHEIENNDDGTCNIVLKSLASITYDENNVVILTKSGVLILLKSNEFSRIIIQ